MDTGRPAKEPDLEGLEEFVAGDPRLKAIKSAAGGVPVFLVGGSVRDALLGHTPHDLDVAVEGELDGLVEVLGPASREYPRFMTARLEMEQGPVDLARTRSESYPRPGALPDVEPASLGEDLARRDFTFNAIAVPLSKPGEIIDPFGGIGALAEGRLTLLRENSLLEDPTRALRGARYAARFGFHPDQEMIGQLAVVDLGVISDDRLWTEIKRFASEPDGALALSTARQWGLIDTQTSVIEIIATAQDLLQEEPWAGYVEMPTVLEALLGPDAGVSALPLEPPPLRIDQYELIARTSPAGLLIARAEGRTWLDWWPTEGCDARLEIDGDSLVEAGVEPGPAVGAGLRAALAEVLERGAVDRSQQMETALSAAQDAASD